MVLGADTEGNACVQLKWPADAPKAAVIQVLTAILIGLNKGAWQPVLLQSVLNHGINSNQREVAEAIVNNVLEQDKASQGKILCVDPTDVFKVNNE